MLALLLPHCRYDRGTATGERGVRPDEAYTGACAVGREVACLSPVVKNKALC